MRVFSSIPFSRSIVLPASMISRLMSLPLVDHVAPHDLLVRDEYRLAALRAEPDPLLAGGQHLAAESLPAGDLVLGADGHAPPDGVGEVRRLAERPLEARRRDVDRVTVEIPSEDVRHPLAERVIHPAGVVDVDAEALRGRELDREHLDPRQACLDYLGHLALERPLGSTCIGQMTVLPQKRRSPRSTRSTRGASGSGGSARAAGSRRSRRCAPTGPRSSSSSPRAAPPPAPRCSTRCRSRSAAPASAKTPSGR